MSNWETRARKMTEAVNEFLKRKPAVQKKRAHARALAARAKALYDRANALLEPYGIDREDGGIRSEEKFVKAGGKLPAPPHKRWSADTVIAELAAASPKEAKVILARYNIRWE